MLNRHGETCYESLRFTDLARKLRSSRGAGLVTAEVPHSAANCRVAFGQVAAVCHDNPLAMPKQMPWDIAAPKLILEEAGGFLCDLDGEHFSSFDVRPYIAAESLALAHQILELSE